MENSEGSRHIDNWSNETTKVFNDYVDEELNILPASDRKDYIGRPKEDFEKDVKEMSKYYNVDILVENENTDKLTKLFSKSYSDINPKKQKVVTINDKVIKYTHCIPTNIVIIKLTWKQKLKLLLGLKVNAIVNTYLNGGKVELTVLKIEE